VQNNLFATFYYYSIHWHKKIKIVVLFYKYRPFSVFYVVCTGLVLFLAKRFNLVKTGQKPYFGR